MSFRPSRFCSCGVPSVHGLSGPAGLPLLRVSSSQFSVVECGVFVGCQCSHIYVLPCTLCPLFWCCLYKLYVIASLCICNCLCLCTFFFVLAPYTNLHVFCIPISMLLYVHIVCKFFCACLCLSTCFCALDHPSCVCVYPITNGNLMSIRVPSQYPHPWRL